MSEPYDIAVAGAGFSGLMVIANIVRHQQRTKGVRKVRIFWADPEIEWGHGLAYSTYEPCHLLNVRADRMGAWADGIDDFWRWLQKHYPGQYKADDFAPRVLFGEYLAEIREGLGPIPLEPVKIKAARRKDELWSIDAGKKTIQARHLVLATGNPPSAKLEWPDNDRYVNNFWRWRLEGGSGQFLPGDGTVVIAGAGLTAADAMLSLLADAYKGQMVCVSPHGQLPAVHEPVVPYPDADRLARDMAGGNSCLHYMRTLRRHCETFGDWRSVVDSLRPYLTALWRALDEREKTRFMRHLWSRWNVRRHRMAPQIAQTLQACGQARVIAGRIVETAEDGTVTIQPRHGREPLRITASKILNCTGPSYRKMLDQNALLSSLKGGGAIRPGPLGLGMASPAADSGLYAIGTPMLGENLETTAVPELRAQAAVLASLLSNIAQAS